MFSHSYLFLSTILKNDNLISDIFVKIDVKHLAGAWNVAKAMWDGISGE